MTLLIIVLLKDKQMKISWKSVALYVVKVVEMLLTGAAGGIIGTNL